MSPHAIAFRSVSIILPTTIGLMLISLGLVFLEIGPESLSNENPGQPWESVALLQKVVRASSVSLMFFISLSFIFCVATATIIVTLFSRCRPTEKNYRGSDYKKKIWIIMFRFLLVFTLASPNLLTTAGILGTFAGLTEQFAKIENFPEKNSNNYDDQKNNKFDLSGTLKENNQSESDKTNESKENSGKIDTLIQGIFKGMANSFSTSLMGIAASLVISFLFFVESALYHRASLWIRDSEANSHTMSGTGSRSGSLSENIDAIIEEKITRINDLFEDTSKKFQEIVVNNTKDLTGFSDSDLEKFPDIDSIVKNWQASHLHGRNIGRSMVFFLRKLSSFIQHIETISDIATKIREHENSQTPDRSRRNTLLSELGIAVGDIESVLDDLRRTTLADDDLENSNEQP